MITVTKAPNGPWSVGACQQLVGLQITSLRKEAAGHRVSARELLRALRDNGRDEAHAFFREFYGESDTLILKHEDCGGE